MPSRSADDPLAGLSELARSRLVRAELPSWLPPALATLRHEPFSDPEWIYERKLDGIRCLAFKRAGGDVELLSRNQLPLHPRFPELVPAIRRQPAAELVIDSELVAVEGDSESFSRLQRAGNGDVRVELHVFDILHLNGWDLRALPLLERKALLARALAFGSGLAYVDYQREHGIRLLEAACAAGWEGLIAKRADSSYPSGRTREWLKLKCSRRQELVIGGFTDPKESRVGIGAILVGYYEGEALRYAGKVGTGFDNAMLRELAAELARRERSTPPFSDRGLPNKGVHWVRPELVCEVGFSEWTRDGRLRHPTFLGLRSDKSPQDVVREQEI